MRKSQGKFISSFCRCVWRGVKLFVGVLAWRRQLEATATEAFRVCMAWSEAVCGRAGVEEAVGGYSN
ncbi:hypothetical protein PVK06_001147 [Gossypium arboreum]|uniref:Uncharacterized protein n=1 Tax=Gossypium arboreum TaxID=29729 RepID=A0ABR0R0C9_GOSAR|nr:hypothetical protein PVK06_001147 [Gossypium arboreum]